MAELHDVGEFWSRLKTPEKLGVAAIVALIVGYFIYRARASASSSPVLSYTQPSVSGAPPDSGASSGGTTSATGSTDTTTPPPADTPPPFVPPTQAPPSDTPPPAAPPSSGAGNTNSYAPSPPPIYIFLPSPPGPGTGAGDGTPPRQQPPHSQVNSGPDRQKQAPVPTRPATNQTHSPVPPTFIQSPPNTQRRDTGQPAPPPPPPPRVPVESGTHPFPGAGPAPGRSSAPQNPPQKQAPPRHTGGGGPHTPKDI